MSANSQATVSIVVPIYNEKKFLIAAIESVRRQTYSDWELVLCDNSTENGDPNLLESYLEKISDHRIRLIHQEHISFAEDWNRSVAHARCEFIKVLPSDDILLPDCLEIQVALLQKHGDVGFVSSGKQLIDASGNVCFERYPLREGHYDWSTLGHKLFYAIVNLVGEPGGVLFRRDLLLEHGLFNPDFKYFIDVEMYIRWLRKTNLYITERPLYQFRLHGNSVSASSRKISSLEYARLLDLYEENLRLAKRPFLKSYLQKKAYGVAFARSIVFKLVSLANKGLKMVGISGAQP